MPTPFDGDSLLAACLAFAESELPRPDALRAAVDVMDERHVAGLRFLARVVGFSLMHANEVAAARRQVAMVRGRAAPTRCTPDGSQCYNADGASFCVVCGCTLPSLDQEMRAATMRAALPDAPQLAAPEPEPEPSADETVRIGTVDDERN